MYRDDLIETRRGALRHPEPKPEPRPAGAAWPPIVAPAERLPKGVACPQEPRPIEIGCTDWYIYPHAAPTAGGERPAPHLAAKFAAMKRQVTPGPRAWVKRPSAGLGCAPVHGEAPSDEAVETGDAIKAQ